MVHKVFISWKPEEWEIAVWRGMLPGVKVSWPSIDPHGYREATVLVLAQPPAWLGEARRVEFIQTLSAGVHPRIIEFARRRGIPVASSKGCNAAAVAEMVFAHLLAIEKRVCTLDREMKQGVWEPYTRETMLGDLEGKKMLILGFGNIGLEVARRAEAFGIEVVAVARKPRITGKWPVLSVKDLPRLISVVDYIVVTLPLTPETRGLVDAELLSRVKKGAVLINVGRGPVVDEEALLEALGSGRLRAGIDVWWRYPPEEDAPSPKGIHRHPAVLATPHKAGWTRRAKEKCVRFAAGNVARYISGREPLNLLTPLGY